MIKSLHIISGLLLTTNSFSFWPLKSIYYEEIDKIEGGRLYRKKELQIHKFEEDKDGIKLFLDKFIFFLYDPHTGNTISKFSNASMVKHMIFYRMDSNIKEPRKIINKKEIEIFVQQSLKSDKEVENDKYIKSEFSFLNCDFNYEGLFWEFDGFYNRLMLPQNKKPQLIFNPDGSITNNAKYYVFNDSQFINFQKSFDSLSGVKIENTENGVMLSKDNQSVNLDTALKRYYKKNSFQTDLCSAYNAYSEKRSSSEDPKYHYGLFLKYLKPELNRMNSTTLTDAELEKLENSTILAAWYLIPEIVEIKDEKGNNIKVKEDRQMLGLAKGNKTGKLFHWTTDLGQDISVLMQHAWDLK